MRKLRTQAISQVRPRACDPRFFLPEKTRSTRSLGSAGDAPPPAGGEGFGLSTEISLSVSSASPAFGGRRFSDRIRSKRPVRNRPRDKPTRVPFSFGGKARGVAGLPCRSAQLKTYLALSSLQPLRARDGVTTETGLVSCSGRRSRKAATWLILPVVICLSPFDTNTFGRSTRNIKLPAEQSARRQTGMPTGGSQTPQKKAAPVT